MFVRYLPTRRIISSSRCVRSLSSYAFDMDTAVTKVSDNHFTANISNAWSITDAPNGGYLMAIGISAARKCISFREPLSVTSHFVSKAKENCEAQIEVEVLHTAKSTATVQVKLSQLGKLRCILLGNFGDLASFRGPHHNHDKAPELPPLSDCVSGAKFLQQCGNTFPIANMVDFRVPRDGTLATGLISGKIHSTAEWVGWARFSDNRKACLRSMALFCDAFPPPVLNPFPLDWVPTMEYTVHFWGRYEPPADHPLKDWVRVKFSSPHVENGLLHTDGEVWSCDGVKLLAKSRQFARIFSGSKL